MFQVLLVCTGNTCRSPMAEGVLRSLLPSDLAEWVNVASAGTGAVPGVPATLLAVRTLAEQGIDIAGHRSSELTAERIRAADLVLCMEPQHAARARQLAPDAADRVRLITEQGANPGGGERPDSEGISDPLGGGSDQYLDTYHRIRSHLLRWIPVIREAVGRREGVK
jgi:protein-tyrosine-phosphatase